MLRCFICHWIKNEWIQYTVKPHLRRTNSFYCTMWFYYFFNVLLWFLARVNDGAGPYKFHSKDCILLLPNLKTRFLDLLLFGLVDVIKFLREPAISEREDCLLEDIFADGDCLLENWKCPYRNGCPLVDRNIDCLRV